MTSIPTNNDDFFAFAELSLLKEVNFIKKIYTDESIISSINDSVSLPLLFSLAWIGDNTAKDKLIELISSVEKTNLAYSIFLLGQIDEISNFSTISKFLKSENELIRNMARLVIFWGGGRQCKILKNDIFDPNMLGLPKLRDIRMLSSIRKNQINIKDKNILISGVSGVGKTTVLSEMRRIGIKNVLDLDEEVEKSTGYNLLDIFDKFGESAYRAIERSILLDLICRPDIKVIALGGGTASNRKTIKLFNNNCCVVHLSASYQTIKDRLRISIEAGKTNKAAVTLLETLPDAFHQLLYLYREPFQVAVSDYVINTNNMTIAEVVNDICGIYDMAHTRRDLLK